EAGLGAGVHPDGHPGAAGVDQVPDDPRPPGRQPQHWPAGRHLPKDPLQVPEARLALARVNLRQGPEPQADEGDHPEHGEEGYARLRGDPEEAAADEGHHTQLDPNPEAHALFTPSPCPSSTSDPAGTQPPDPTPPR